ncbi:DNA-directed RNA polymerase subunit beta' [Patescibacteria group bacterium]
MKDLILRDFDAIRIYLASTDEILDWSYGEVTKPETINYRTYKSEKNGLFDERIFGPVKNYECYCGKYKGIRYKNVICDKCGVEITTSRVRRERMGHIKLACSVAHVWYFRGIPSKMALLLDISPRNVESVIYFSSFIATEVDSTKKAEAISQVEKDFEKSKLLLEKERDDQAKVMEKENAPAKKGKKKDELKAQEADHKLKQKIQALKATYDEKIVEQEKTYKIIQKKVESVKIHTVLSENEYISLYKYLHKFCKLEIGAEAIKGILEGLDLHELSAQLRENMETAKGQKAIKLSKRLRTVEQFRRADIPPSRMVLDAIPVIPPDLRPMVQLEGGRFATSDLNDLYRRVINRNNRLKRLLDLGAPEIIVRNEKRMLQESVDALFDSSKQRRKTRISRGRKELRSLADMIKGKQGIFRLNLLGKRVDYSGRAVIINGPNLKLNQCGIPKEMALELFKPFVLREIMSRGYAPNVKSARFYLDQKSAEVWDILEDVVEDHPVLLNRAPTLWRLGIQAFYPKLIEGNSVRLHLCVCSGFNADFDGDQMAVHVPLSKKAVKEAKELMISTRNLLNPSNGSPMSIPTKIMLYGVYYMTAIDINHKIHETSFSGKTELLYALRAEETVELRQPVKVMLDGKMVETTPGRVLFNEVVPESFGFVNKAMDRKNVTEMLTRAFETETQEVVVKLIDDLKDLGFDYGTRSGQSVALSDIYIPEEVDDLVGKGRKAVAEVDKNLMRGLITNQEAERLIEDAWYKVVDSVGDAVWGGLEEDNPVKQLVSSGSTRASRSQVNQTSGVIGLVADPTGKTVLMPILSNYKTGLPGLEYFVSARGARKGLVDKGLKTADAGYLTRRLVDVSQEVIVREEDCGTKEGRIIKVGEGTMLQSFVERISGRYTVETVKKGSKIIARRGALITKELAGEIEESKNEFILIRSPLKCEARRGICKKCYGFDMNTRKEITTGAAVGISAAQSIGEPGTQLTLRTFHTGGVAGKDITQGLPRVEELVEARTPKFLAIMSELDGKAGVIKSGDERKIIIMGEDKSEANNLVEYMVDPISEILVEDGEKVVKGQKLTSGHLDLRDLLSVVGVEETQKYLIDEVQNVYSSQGVSINDKHIEIIVKQMFKNVKIQEGGDTDFLSGEIVSLDKFQEENEKTLAVGGEPAVAELHLLGITKSSLVSDSFLAAASFIQTSNVLTDAAASGRVDSLLGLKENVIIGRLIPSGEDAKLE